MNGNYSLHNVKDILFMYGTDVIETPEFQDAFYQIHHVRTTVAVHSINVAVISIVLCILLSRIHVRTDMKDVVRAALCHDLGIMGRHQKYRNNFECSQQHPVDSVEVAKKMNRPKMRFVCVKSNVNFKSGDIYPVQYDSKGKLFVIDDGGYRRPVNYLYIDKDAFLDYMKTVNMVKLED